MEFVKPLVHATALDEIGVPAYFHDAAVVHHHDHIGVMDGGQAVRDANGGAALHEAVQRGLHGALGFGVRYVGSYLLWRLRRKGHRGAYLRIPMEIEASWVARRQLSTAVRDHLPERVAS